MPSTLQFGAIRGTRGLAAVNASTIAAAPAPLYQDHRFWLFLLSPHFAAHFRGCCVMHVGSEGQLVLPRQVSSAGESLARKSLQALLREGPEPR